MARSLRLSAVAAALVPGMPLKARRGAAPAPAAAPVGNSEGQDSEHCPPTFTKEQATAAIAFFRQHGYALLAGTRGVDELRQLNALCDSSQKHHPERWDQETSRKPGSSGGPDAKAALSSNQYLEYPQPLLFHPELGDDIIRGGWAWPIIEELLGGRNLARFVQFEFRETPSGAEDLQMGFHRDQGATLMQRVRDHTRAAPPTDYIAAITLLSPADSRTPNTVLVPGSSGYSAQSVEELRQQMGVAYREVAVQQPAGTTLLYDVATFHTRRDPPTGRGNRGRRTQHSYFSRHPAPPRNEWVVYPKRLADHPDADVRRFYRCAHTCIVAHMARNHTNDTHMRISTCHHCARITCALPNVKTIHELRKYVDDDLLLLRSNWNDVMVAYANSGYSEDFLTERGEKVLMAFLADE